MLFMKQCHSALPFITAGSEQRMDVFIFQVAPKQSHQHTGGQGWHSQSSCKFGEADVKNQAAPHKEQTQAPMAKLSYSVGQTQDSTRGWWELSEKSWGLEPITS